MEDVTTLDTLTGSLLTFAIFVPSQRSRGLVQNRYLHEKIDQFCDIPVLNLFIIG